MSMLARLEEPDKVPCHSARKETSFIRKVILCVPEPFLRYTSVVTQSFSFLGRHQFKFKSPFQTLIYSKILFLSICNVVTWIAQEIFSFNKCNERHAPPLHKHGHAQAHERYMCTLDQSFA